MPSHARNVIFLCKSKIHIIFISITNPKLILTINTYARLKSFNDCFSLRFSSGS